MVSRQSLLPCSDALRVLHVRLIYLSYPGQIA